MIGSAKEQMARARYLLGGFAAESEKPDGVLNESTSGSWLLFDDLRQFVAFTGLSAAEFEKRLLALLLFALLVLLISLVTGHFLMLLLPSALFFLEYQQLRRKSYQRAQTFEKDYPALLLAIASGIRTGLDPMAAFCRTAELFPEASLLRKEVEKLNEIISAGSNEADAVNDFAATINHPDLKLFKTALILARKEGSSLSESLRRLAKVTRQRQSFRRKIRSAVAMQRLSIIGIALCTVIIGLIQAVTNMEALRDAVRHPIGSNALLVGILLIMTGLVWMMQMGRARI